MPDPDPVPGGRGPRRTKASSSPLLSRLYPILDADLFDRSAAEAAIASFARAGVRLVQFRAKALGAEAFAEWAAPAVAAARSAGVSTLINDRADVAKAVRADGVHVGQDDVSPSLVRRFMGPEAVVGLSTHSVAEARAAASEPLDYIAIGPVFSTTTKPDARPALGPEGVSAVRAVTARPLVAIGGITLERAGEVLAAGADSLAVISALFEDRRPLETVVEAWMGLL